MGKKKMFMKTFGVVQLPLELILTVKTDNVGTSNDDQFTLQVIEGAVAFNYDVEYDGQTLTGLTDDVTLTFPSGIGTYDIIISGIFPKLFLQQSPDKSKLIECKQWGNTGFSEPSAIQSAFAYNNLLTTVSATDVPVGSFLYLSGMFSFCSSLVSIPNLNNWDVSNVTSMASMFREAPNFNGNMSSWNTSNVTDMSYMLSNVPLFNGDISSWDVSSVTNFKWFLYNKPIWNNDLSGWNVSGATNMERMFQSCPSFNSNISNWNVSGVTNMYIMFAFCTSFDQDLSSWQISQVTNLQEFMTNCKLSTANYDALLIGWDAQGAMSYSGTVDFGNSQYTLGGTAEVARTSLIAKWGGITDGGGVAPLVPYTTNLVASYSFDTDLTDYTGNNNGTTPGTIIHSPFKVNNGADFSGGVNDYVALPNTSDDFTFQDGAGSDIAFSISFWIDDLDGSNNNDAYFWVGNDLNSRSVDIARNGNSISSRCYTNTNNRLEYSYFTGGAVVPVHFCMTYDGSKTPSGLKFYVNGVDALGTSYQVGTFTGINPTLQMQTRIGTIANFNSFEYEGKMDEFHVWKDRELTSAEVLDIYNTENLGNSILPIQIPLQNIISYYKFENNVLDEVGVNNGIATDITYTLGKIGNSAVFNGSTSKVLLPTNFLPYSPSFSVHCVFKATDINTEYRLIALSDNVNMPYILLRLNNTVLGRIGFYVWNSNSPTEIFSDSYDSTTYTQVTATIVENGDFKLYINGNLIDTKSISYFSKLPDQNYLGSLRNGNGRFFNGDLDDTSFWNKELSQTEITEIYNTQNAGNSILSFSYTTNLVASYSFDTDFSDYTGNNPLTAFGGAIAGVTGGKVSDCAELDGNSDYTIAVDSDDFSFTDGTNDLPFSISFWANFQTHSSNPTNASWIITKRDASTNEEYQVTFFDNSFQFWLFSQGGNSAYVTASLPFTPITGGTTWQHFTVTYNGSQTFSGIKMYIDGVSQTLTDSSVGAYLGMINGSEPINIGSQGWNPTLGEFDGKLDEFHIWKNRELTQSEVTNIYNTENTGNSILPLQIPLQNIISEYKFENNVLDTVGANDGTATAITYVPGLVGQASRFIDSKIDFGTSTDFNFSNGTNDITKSISFILENYDTENQYILGKNNNGWEWVMSYFTGKLNFIIYGDTTADRIRLDYTFAFGINTPRHFTFTYDGSGSQNGLKLFIDGILISTVNSTLGTYTRGGVHNSNLIVGQTELALSTYSFNGDLDCLRFWDKELSQAEITQIATAELAGTDINP